MSGTKVSSASASSVKLGKEASGEEVEFELVRQNFEAMASDVDDLTRQVEKVADSAKGQSPANIY